MKTFLIVATLCFGLVACGGGGGDSAPTPAPILQDKYDAATKTRACYNTTTNKGKLYFTQAKDLVTKNVIATFGPFKDAVVVSKCSDDLIATGVASNYKIDNIFVETK